MKTTPLLFLILLTISCNSSQNSGNLTDSNNANQTVNQPQKPDTTPVSFTGIYVFGDEVNTLQDCQTGAIYWVEDSTSSLKKFYAEAVRPLPYPYEGVLAEVTGYLSGKPEAGNSADYSHVLIVTGVKIVQPRNFKTECYPYEFIAMGNEPFWSVDIIPAEQLIVLKDIGMNKVFVFPYRPANIGGGVFRFETSNAANEKLVIVLREERCSDGMSDRRYNYSAEVEINGRTLKGCAIKKGDRFEDRP